MMSADLLPVASWVLRQQRRGFVLWSLALAAVSAMYISFWPAMGAGDEMQALIDNLPEGLVAALGYDRIGTAAGYLESTVFGLLAPALLLVFGIATGARILAGEEEVGALELELTHPVGRRRVLLERFGALAAGLALLCTVVLVVTLVFDPLLEMGLGANAIVATVAGLFLFVLAMASVTLAVGAATGRRAIALAVGSALAVLAFVADAIAPLLDDGRWLEAVNPFAWYLGSDPLTHGWDPAGLLGLAAVTVVALASALVVYDRRDLGV